MYNVDMYMAIFSVTDIQARSQLAALDLNIMRSTVRLQDGKPQVRQVYSKRRKQWVMRKVYDTQSYVHVQTLMDLLMNSISTGEIQHISPSEEVHLSIRGSTCTPQEHITNAKTVI